MNVLTALLVVLAGFLTIGFGVNVDALHASDAAGNGLAEGFAVVLAIADWLILTILILICAARDGFTRYAGIAMLCATLLGIAGQAVALQLLMASKAEGLAATLLPKVAVAVPMLVIIRVAWGIFPPLRNLVPETAGSWAPILLLAVIALVPFPFRPRYAAQKEAAEGKFAARTAEYEREQNAEDDQRIAGTLAKIAALSSDSKLFSAIVFCADTEPAIRDAARAKARTFNGRQADAEELPASGHEPTLRELPNFDLKLTSTICVEAR